MKWQSLVRDIAPKIARKLASSGTVLQVLHARLQAASSRCTSYHAATGVPIQTVVVPVTTSIRRQKFHPIVLRGGFRFRQSLAAIERRRVCCQRFDRRILSLNVAISFSLTHVSFVHIHRDIHFLQ